MYSMIVLLGMVSMYYFLRLFQERTKTVAALYILSSVALLYSHYSAALMLLVQNIYFFGLVLFKKKRGQLNIARWIGFETGIFLLYIPWVLTGIARLYSLQAVADYWAPRPTIDSLRMTFMTFAGSRNLLLLLLACIFAVPFFGRKPLQGLKGFITKEYYFMFLWGVAPVLILFFVSKGVTSYYAFHYLICASPGLYLLAGMGLGRITDRNLMGAAIAVVFCVFAMNVLTFSAGTYKLPWNQAAEHVNENAKPGDLLITNDPLCVQRAFDYYFNRKDVYRAIFKDDPKAPFTIIRPKSVEILKRNSRNAKRIWILLGHVTDNKGLIRDAFNKDYRMISNNFYTSRSYITQKTDNIIQLICIEKKE